MKSLLIFYFCIGTFLLVACKGRRNGAIDNRQRPVKGKALFEREDTNRPVVESDADCDEDSGSFWAKIKKMMGYGSSGTEDDDHDDIDEDSFYERTFGRLQPWWKGRNVCKREEETVLPRSSSNGFDLFNLFTSSCVDTGAAYKCSLETVKNATNILRTLTYECCYGYGRNRDSKGCPIKLNLKPFAETLERLNLTKFLEILRETNMLTFLNSGNFTVFAPNNEALESAKRHADIDVVVASTDDKMQFVRTLISNNIVAKKIHLDDMEDEQMLKSVNEDGFVRTNFFTYPKPFVTANCAKVLSFDHIVTNGYVHVVDRQTSQTNQVLQNLLDDDARFTIFRSLMDEDTKSLLADPKSHFTVFAFTDETFATLPEQTIQRIQNKESCLRDIIKQHIVPHTICSVAAYSTSHVMTQNGMMVSMNRSRDDTVFFNGKKMVTVDRMAVNGVMHVIDGVVLNPKNVDIVDALEPLGYANLASELRQTGLAAELSRRKTSGLFLPPLASVQNISSMDMAAKKQLLQNHIVERVQFLPYRKSTTVQTDAGTVYRITMSSDFATLAFHQPKRTIGCAKIIQQPMTVCNGVIRLIDRILPVPTLNVVDLLRSREELSEFTLMVEASGLDELLQLEASNRRPVSHTVFAPDNRAMQSGFDDTSRRKMLSNVENLRAFVKRHIVEGSVCCHLMESDGWFDPYVETEGGTKLKTRGSETHQLTVGDATLKKCNLEATNGLVHVVDKVLPARRRFLGLFEY